MKFSSTNVSLLKPFLHIIYKKGEKVRTNHINKSLYSKIDKTNNQKQHYILEIKIKFHKNQNVKKKKIRKTNTIFSLLFDFFGLD